MSLLSCSVGLRFWQIAGRGSGRLTLILEIAAHTTEAQVVEEKTLRSARRTFTFTLRSSNSWWTNLDRRCGVGGKMQEAIRKIRNRLFEIRNGGNWYPFSLPLQSFQSLQKSFQFDCADHMYFVYSWEKRKKGGIAVGNKVGAHSTKPRRDQNKNRASSSKI